MIGPELHGHWSSIGREEWGHLLAGRRYRVIRAFDDFESTHHPVGEEWTLLGVGRNFYDPELSLIVSFDGDKEWLITLVDAEPYQSHVIRALESYFLEQRVEGG
jgi:hypothetical protein